MFTCSDKSASSVNTSECLLKAHLEAKIIIRYTIILCEKAQELA